VVVAFRNDVGFAVLRNSAIREIESIFAALNTDDERAVSMHEDAKSRVLRNDATETTINNAVRNFEAFAAMFSHSGCALEELEALFLSLNTDNQNALLWYEMVETRIKRATTTQWIDLELNRFRNFVGLFPYMAAAFEELDGFFTALNSDDPYIIAVHNSVEENIFWFTATVEQIERMVVGYKSKVEVHNVIWYGIIERVLNTEYEDLDSAREDAKAALNEMKLFYETLNVVNPDFECCCVTFIDLIIGQIVWATGNIDRHSSISNIRGEVIQAYLAMEYLRTSIFEIDFRWNLLI
jgi:hypothetical protein